MSAYACVPYAGSEPGVGWEMLVMAARKHDVTVLTTEVNAAQTREALAQAGVSNVNVVAVKTPKPLAAKAYGFGLGHLDYLLWQRRARRVITELAPEHDVVHHVTYTSDWQPSAALSQKSLPVVWGPVGSLAPVPWFLIPYLFLRSIGAQAMRHIVTRLFRIGRLGQVNRPGVVVVAVSGHTARFFRRARNIRIEATCALDPVSTAPAAVPARDTDPGRRTILFVGRLVAFKGAGVALATMKKLPPEWHMDIYGTGVEEKLIQDRAERLGISDRVHFLGVRPRAEVEQALREADVLLFPSMNDGSSYTVAEAIRVGCPVVCLDLGGPPVLVQGTSGAIVKPDRHAVANLARAIQTVQRDEPSDRFSRERFPDLLTEWYETAVADAATAEKA